MDNGSKLSCLAQECLDLVPSQHESTSRHAIVAAAQLQALVKQSDEIELERKQLKQRVTTLAQALDV